ncbi:MAG TPA: ribonuclease HII [Lachnospiraceae bacterium]|nr:ribonuclease HII [Lachnospiraceae bacterium]
MKINEISDMLKNAPPIKLPGLISEFEGDERAGVQKAVISAKKRLDAHKKELVRLDEMFYFEKKYLPECPIICGIDEVGRGPLAGPVVAGAVVLPPDVLARLDDPDGMHIEGLNDSKQVSAKRREALYDEITDKAIACGIGVIPPSRIDEINILQATYEAMRLAIEDLEVVPDMLLNDAVNIPDVPIRQVGIVKGDARSLSIAAASIVAKVTRDRMMVEMAELYPEYGFDKHVGYGTAVHIQAIRDHGPCPIHRRTFITKFV